MPKSFTVLLTRAEAASGVVWDTARNPTLTRVVAALPAINADEAFEHALGVVLDGAAQRLPPSRRRRRSPRPTA